MCPRRTDSAEQWRCTDRIQVRSATPGRNAPVRQFALQCLQWSRTNRLLLPGDQPRSSSTRRPGTTRCGGQASSIAPTRGRTPSLFKLQVKVNVNGSRRVRDGANGDKVRASLGVCARCIKSDAAGKLHGGASSDGVNPIFGVGRAEIVE